MDTRVDYPQLSTLLIRVLYLLELLASQLDVNDTAAPLDSAEQDCRGLSSIKINASISANCSSTGDFRHKRWLPTSAGIQTSGVQLVDVDNRLAEYTVAASMFGFNVTMLTASGLTHATLTTTLRANDYGSSARQPTYQG